MKSMIVSALVLALSITIAGAQVRNGDPAPDFRLRDIFGNEHALSDYRGKTVVLEWINHGCPFVQKHYDKGHMQALQREATANGVIWLSICSSAPGKQGHYSLEEWQKINEEKQGAATAILLDEEGTVGRLYGAKTTPHMYIVNAEGVLVYQGAIDSIRSTDPDDVPKAKNYVREALADLAAGRPVGTPQTQPYGCSVKYK
ncbi:MAG: thioredoxin family protein [Kiritimatiellae bacterium]|nr:thioredoxin family protein [Kiritimatiellia bacterium]MDW8458481.1 thioredoxin family protein [Verrucomicrobiota bacterium]